MSALSCPRCGGKGKLTEWFVERKIAMLAFLYVRHTLLCHLCAGRGVVSERTFKKWRIKRGDGA